MIDWLRTAEVGRVQCLSKVVYPAGLVWDGDKSFSKIGLILPLELVVWLGCTPPHTHFPFKEFSFITSNVICLSRFLRGQNKSTFKELSQRSLRDSLAVRSTGYSSIGPRPNSQHPHGSSQPPVHPAPGDPTPF